MPLINLAINTRIIASCFTSKFNVYSVSRRSGRPDHTSSAQNIFLITKAVESKFDVKVLKVATIRQLGKVKQMTVRSGGRTIRTSGRKSEYKKAIITLDAGSNIDIMRGETQS